DRRHQAARHLRRRRARRRRDRAPPRRAGRAQGPSARRRGERRSDGPRRALLRILPRRAPRLRRPSHPRIRDRDGAAGAEGDRARPPRDRGTAERARRRALPVSAWTVLGIERTSDLAEIRRAYARRLKAIDVDADPQAFIKLREALQRASAEAARKGQSGPRPIVFTAFGSEVSFRAADPARRPPAPA